MKPAGRVAIALAGLLPLTPVQAEQDWQLVWSDEFDAGRIDRAKWTFDEDCWGGGNEEHQCYTSSPRNAAVEQGVLMITARNERTTGLALPQHLRRTSAMPDAK